MPDTFEALRAQGEINRIVGEAPDEELDEEFVARQRTRLEDIRRMLLRERVGIQEEERQWVEGGHYPPWDHEDVRAHLLAEDLDTPSSTGSS